MNYLTSAAVFAAASIAANAGFAASCDETRNLGGVTYCVIDQTKDFSEAPSFSGGDSASYDESVTFTMDKFDTALGELVHVGVGGSGSLDADFTHKIEDGIFGATTIDGGIDQSKSIDIVVDVPSLGLPFDLSFSDAETVSVDELEQDFTYSLFGALLEGSFFYNADPEDFKGPGTFDISVAMNMSLVTTTDPEGELSGTFDAKYFAGVSYFFLPADMPSIPLPAGLPLMLAAVGALALVRRRKS